MEPSSDTYFKNYSEFEVVSRKNKKKKRQRKKQFTSLEQLQSESEVSQAVESTGDSNLTDDSVSELGCDDSPTEGISSSQLCTLNSSTEFPKNGVRRDAVMNSAPSYTEIPEKEKVFEEETEDKLIFQGSTQEKYEPPLLNMNALSKYATTYELERFEKNALIIFNLENIDGHEKRLGTEKDVEMLKNTFGKFGFEAVEYKDFTKDEIFETLRSFTSSKNNLSDYGCIAVAVLTHGSNNGLLRARDQQFSEIEIIKHFKVINNLTLVTKPKLLIVQACRGTKIVPGVAVFHSGKIRRDLDEAVEPYILPVESDMLVLHSSYEGSPSHRNELHGSWFIQELCNKIVELAATQDLESIVIEVKREVAINHQHEEYNRRTLEMDINKQMPVTTSTLIRKLYLRKHGEASPKVESISDRPRPSITTEIRKDVLDNAVVNTPLLCQFGPCSCFLDHFNYMRKCLKYFVEENPLDDTAKCMWEVANTFEDGVEFNTSKEKMNKAISKHLYNNAQTSQYYKYLYFCKH
ncbi:unnamed protein product [Arctia plantaginis]|uniref:Caspase-4 n=1 Tax=Arctia plantaginis TaxID=874455 RepID=A0A8S1B9S3_ARCPL|nr:unnamed protein product [Arctia plantaginis]